VTLDDGTKYMVDVGFGGDGATKPIPLVDGHVTPNLGSQELRLVYDAIPQQIEKTQKYWIYQYRNNSGLDWNSFYCFSEMEFLQQDFEVMNYFSSKHPFSIHTYAVLVVKFLRRQGEIYGKVMLVNDKVKQNTGGRTSVAKECKNEDERVDALKEDFGIILTDEEREGIRGMTTELL
jgi:arylamine N-acetyltransferase